MSVINRQALLDEIEITSFEDYGDYITVRDLIAQFPSADRKTEHRDCINCESADDCAKCRGFKDESQTDYGDFANRLAYERGVKHAWEVAQKVFDSTLAFYKAEDLAEQIDKDINVRSNEQSLKGSKRLLKGKTEPQTERELEQARDALKRMAVEKMTALAVMCSHTEDREAYLVQKRRKEKE